MKVFNLGSLNIDYLYSMKNFPKPGETITSTDYTINAGGKGLNQSIALSRGGADVYHIGKISNNDKFLIDILEESYVRVDFIETDAKVSGHANIYVTEKGENNIVLFPGGNIEIDKSLIDKALKLAKKDDILLMQNETSMIGYAAKKAKEIGMTTFLNAAPIDNKLDNLDFTYIDIISINETEAYELTGKTNPLEINEYLKKRNPNIQLLMTIGKNGSAYYGDDTVIKTGIFETDVVDTTAAGDTYIGYFLAKLIDGYEIEACMVWASKASSLTISKKGAAMTIPYHEDLDDDEIFKEK